jgi:hypothetical protein
VDTVHRGVGNADAIEGGSSDDGETTFELPGERHAEFATCEDENESGLTNIGAKTVAPRRCRRRTWRGCPSSSRLVPAPFTVTVSNMATTQQFHFRMTSNLFYSYRLLRRFSFACPPDAPCKATRAGRTTEVRSWISNSGKRVGNFA